MKNEMTPPARLGRLGGLFFWFLLCFAAASTGILFPPGEWYAGLRKPSWNPPNEIFSPVWTFLYACMAVAAWRVWRLYGRAAKKALGLFLLQLALNALWTPLFFGWHRMGAALVDIVLLFFAILATIFAFSAKDKWASWLLIPYLAWVGFASYLNFTLWRLNS